MNKLVKLISILAIIALSFLGGFIAHQTYEKHLDSKIEKILNQDNNTTEGWLNKEQTKFLFDVGNLINYAEAMGYGEGENSITGGELWRTKYQQIHNIRTGVSKTMKSKHLNRLAIDLNVIKDGKLGSCEDYQDLGEYWESLDPKNKWGGNWRTFKDCPHFQRSVK